jgi:hypothetical protein
MSAETVTFTRTVAIADADGRPIREGSVLRHIKEPAVGVVDLIVRPGTKVQSIIPACIGDLHIRLGPGVHRVTNRYTDWRHVPHADQTYAQRYLGWVLTKEGPDDYDDELSRMTKDEARAVAGMMALLPHDVVDYAYGPLPDTLEGALEILSHHLAKLSGQEQDT